MTDCSTDNLIPRRCAEKFERISRSLGKIDRMAEDVSALRKAVVGNGEAKRSLAFRVGQLEAVQTTRRGARQRWGDRVWKLLTAVALVLLGWLIRSA